MRFTPEQIRAAMTKCDMADLIPNVEMKLFGEEDYSRRQVRYALEEFTCDGMWVEEVLRELREIGRVETAALVRAVRTDCALEMVE